MVKARDHEIVRALETHPRTMERIDKMWSWALRYSVMTYSLCFKIKVTF